MATTPSWTEFNGSGFIATAAVGSCNRKNIDDATTTAYNLSPIPASNPSMWKIQSLTLLNSSGAGMSVYGLSYFISTAIGPSSTWTVVAAVPGTGSQTYRANGGTASLLSASTPTTGFTVATMPTSAGTLLGNWGGTSYTASSTPSTGPFATPITTATTAGGAGAAVSIANGATLYATALYTQLTTQAGAAAGAIGSLQITATWTEF